MFFLYEALLYLVFIVILPFVLLVGFLRGKYLVNFRERVGVYKHPAGRHDLWIHAVSVGEVMAGKTVYDRLLTLRPETNVVVTTTTVTGQQMARRLFKGATITYFPFDFSWAVRSFLDHHGPRALVLVETELWPNVTRVCSERKIPVMIVNGRISDRSFGRYRTFRFILRRMFERYHSILVREAIDRDRFVAIGAPRDRVEVAGNVKFDFEPDATPLAIAPALERLIRGRKVLVAGSTVDAEDELLVPLLPALIEELGCFVCIAPRKPERFEIVAGLLTTAGLRVVRRSEWHGEDRNADVFLVDTIGELARIYRFADVAFVGGSLLPGTGGHNPIEPAACGVPVAFGPHMSNFREIATTFLDAGAARTVDSPEDLMRFVREMFEQDELRLRMARAASEAVDHGRGAAGRTAARIMDILK
jgi:3-deoxy-D-manno-octulosonic-acid transferase